jgi:uncharacterized protein
MARIIVLGAAGSLGQHVVRQALQAGHSVTALLRHPPKLPQELLAGVRVKQADLLTASPHRLAECLAGHDVVINVAGYVSDGQRFVDLVARVVEAMEFLEAGTRPRAWFVGGLAVLDLAGSDRRGVQLPLIRKTYWPHARNLERLEASVLDWRLLCPGPMVEGPAIGVSRLRTSLDRLPVDMPDAARWLPSPLVLALLARRVPQMIVSYADAAALMLAHLEEHSATSRRRFGLALPLGMRGHKDQWTARKR